MLRTRQTATVEPVVLAAFGLLFAMVYLWAARRVGLGRRRYVWLLSVPTLLGSIVILWAATRIWAEAPVAGIGLVAIAIPSLVLNVRRIRRDVAGPGEGERPGELSSAAFDYLIWVAIGVPFAFVVMLLVLLVTGELSSSN
jgi:hypothetical protein